MHTDRALLGGLTARAFLARHWQKRPLLVRGAIPGFRGLVDRDALFRLAARADVTSRLVLAHAGRRTRWERHDGPFDALSAEQLPARDWTLLVHGLETLVPGGWPLLDRFSFVPAARVDDLMVSHAAAGGSVGPHDDRYDVFLLQGPGRRRWRIARGGDRARDPRAAIEVLARFEPEEEWVLEAGDMLYLPPGVAHHGIAEEPCSTYSIGFLAPAERDLAQAFLGYLAGVAPIDADALYADPDLRPPRERHALPDAMIAYARRVSERLLARPDGKLVEDFLGCFLTRPRAHQAFAAPARPLDADAFAARLRQAGALRLALGSRGLWRRSRLYLNGEAQVLPPRSRATLRTLVAARVLRLPQRLDDPTRRILHAWYAAGWIALTAR